MAATQRLLQRGIASPTVDDVAAEADVSRRTVYTYFPSKGALIAEEPAIYFTTPHFDGHPSVLVRLAAIPVADLEELVVEAWLTQAGKRLSQGYLSSD